MKFKHQKKNISELNIFGINPVKEAILTKNLQVDIYDEDLFSIVGERSHSYYEHI